MPNQNSHSQKMVIILLIDRCYSRNWKYAHIDLDRSIRYLDISLHVYCFFHIWKLAIRIGQYVSRCINIHNMK